MGLADALQAETRIGYERVPTKGCALGPQEYQATFEQLQTGLPGEYMLVGFPRDGPGTCKGVSPHTSPSPEMC